jgi:hypothetical protein
MDDFELYPLQIASDPAIAAHLKAVALHEELVMEYQQAALKEAEQNRKIAALMMVYEAQAKERRNAALARWIQHQKQKAQALQSTPVSRLQSF